MQESPLKELEEAHRDLRDLIDRLAVTVQPVPGISLVTPFRDKTRDLSFHEEPMLPATGGQITRGSTHYSVEQVSGFGHTSYNADLQRGEDFVSVMLQKFVVSVGHLGRGKDPDIFSFSGEGKVKELNSGRQCNDAEIAALTASLRRIKYDLESAEASHRADVDRILQEQRGKLSGTLRVLVDMLVEENL